MSTSSCCTQSPCRRANSAARRLRTCSGAGWIPRRTPISGGLRTCGYRRILVRCDAKNWLASREHVMERAWHDGRDPNIGDKRTATTSRWDSNWRAMKLHRLPIGNTIRPVLLSSRCGPACRPCKAPRLWATAILPPGANGTRGQPSTGEGCGRIGPGWRA
ncbi:hypothetical protein GBAR_LOCUS16215 [Geodia barretti]|uniref:Uncharacterized protein n=1 Tax=Geodia barretti TaxID=519541 RepID=A0AA35WTJ8_GEOBA|nr:hypothetical protein GBAR_LOCUS16215 [Geodia barretti]